HQQAAVKGHGDGPEQNPERENRDGEYLLTAHGYPISRGASEDVKASLRHRSPLTWRAVRPQLPSPAPGRPRGTGEVRDLTRQYTSRALRTLVAMLEAKSETCAFAAAGALLDRTWGRPPQTIAGRRRPDPS